MASHPEMSELPASDTKKSTLDQSENQLPAAIHHVENADLEDSPKVAWSTILAVFVSYFE
jgi:hypothetical protein